MRDSKEDSLYTEKELEEFIISTFVNYKRSYCKFLDFSLTVKAATLIFITGCGSAISSAKQGKSGFIYNLVKTY